jgi:hypothetical protein
MGFLLPAFLVGMLAIAYPIALHLRQRDRDRPQRFPSLMFLEQMPIRTEQRQRITDWPLLLLRMLALALLAMAFARPVFGDRALLGGDSRKRAVVVLLDRSLSMGYDGVWARALDSARAVVNGLDAGDRVATVAYDDAAEVLQRLTDDRTAALGSLERVTPEPRGTRLAPALRTARQLLFDAPFAASEIVVISDLQRSAAAGVAGVELPAGVRVRGINVGPATWENSSVRAVEAQRVTTGDRTVLAVKARVQSHGLSAPRTITAQLVLNGRDAASAAVTLVNGETVVTFTPVPAPEGAVALRVALPADALAADDTLVAVVPRDEPLRVSLVEGAGLSGSETLFFEQALRIGRAPAMQLDRWTAAGGNERLARTGVALLWDAVPPNDASLGDWVANGGGVVVLVGRRLAAQPPARSALLPVSASGMTDRLADRGGTLRDLRTEHALFRPFRESPDALGAIRSFRYARLEVPPGADILARFDDGQPAVIEQRIGEGRVIISALPMDNLSGDFPLHPTYLPFVRQLMLHASGRDATPLWRATGETWSIPGSVADPVVTAPDGEVIRPVRDSAGAAVPLGRAGLYRLSSGRAGSEVLAMQAVNVPSAESELAPMDTTELLLGVRTATSGGATDTSATTVPATLEELERRQNPWRVLLALVVLFLAAETWMATRGRRAVARHGVARPRSESGTSDA